MNVLNISDYQQFSKEKMKKTQYVSNATILLRYLLL